MQNKWLNLIGITAVLTSGLASAKEVLSTQYASEIDDIIKQIQLPDIPNNSADIRQFGAKADDNKDDRDAILKAINQLANNGGGKLVVPKGKWLSNGPIVLKSNIELHLSEGAHLLFSAHARDYLPVVKTRWEGTEVFAYSPLIYAKDVHDVAITGSGTINGNANSEFHAWHKKANDDMQVLRTMGIKGVPVEQRQFGEGHFLRPSLIQFFGAKRVLLENYTSLNSPFWVNHLVYTDHVTVRNVKVDSHFANNDGVDLDSVSYGLVENSHFRTGDDSVVIKSGRDKDGRDINKPSRYIVVRNNDMGGEDGIGLGSEMSAGISHVYFDQNILRKGKAAIRFKGSLDRGGLVEHIRVTNMHIAEFEDLFWFQLNYPGVIEGGHPSTYRDIVFDNIEVEKTQRVFEIHAYKAAPLSNVTVKNVRVKQAETPFVLENVTGLKLQNMVINGQRFDGELSAIQAHDK
ncbi:glycoside hydrolase family 28 protein [Neptunicella marina]|uniref:Glycoside hydrolase family 28 protein n=1 Tax=Neptunicella marina TaxID=2125989 RepID=A0A8J6M3M7_9ALTE|nr:glycoside hydrolase family 28 protein [Neptunicella marina]MBC3765501.1 glycoside hydrolase family 28 protein [Neptunicella marina]